MQLLSPNRLLKCLGRPPVSRWAGQIQDTGVAPDWAAWSISSSPSSVVPTIPTIPGPGSGGGGCRVGRHGEVCGTVRVVTSDEGESGQSVRALERAGPPSGGNFAGFGDSDDGLPDVVGGSDWLEPHQL